MACGRWLWGIVLEPLKLQTRVDHSDPVGTFRIGQSGDRLQLERVEFDGDWKRQYSFTLQAHRLHEFAAMCHHHQTSPESHFTTKQICTRATGDSRITLSDMKLIITGNRGRTETRLASEKERNHALREHFGIMTA